MNKKGQALIEFILIMPIFLILIMSLIDVGNIYIKKYELNKHLQVVETMYQNNKSEQIALYTSNNDLTIEEQRENDLITIILRKKVKINAPFLTNILGKNHTIESRGTFYKTDE